MNVSRGLLAGFVATLVLSALMIAKGMMGLMPDFNVIKMLGQMTGGGPVVGWITHFLIGTLAWGIGFAVVYRWVPGNRPWVKGLLFGIAAWLLMMVAFMPMAGVGLFGLALGPMAPIVTLILHIIFGVVLGAVYGRPAVTSAAR